MKRNILVLSLALAGILSTNAFSYEIYKGKVTSHKEWTTGSAKGSFTPNSSSKMKAKLESDKSNIFVYSSANPNKIAAGSIANISGNNFIRIYNDSDQAETYRYTLAVCAMVADHSENCLFMFDTVSLEPTGYFITDVTPQLQLSFDKPGSYRTDVQSYVGIGTMTNSQISSLSSSTVEVS